METRRSTYSRPPTIRFLTVPMEDARLVSLTTREESAARVAPVRLLAYRWSIGNESHLAIRELGQPGRDHIVKRNADGQGTDHFVCEARRFGHHQEQPAADDDDRSTRRAGNSLRNNGSNNVWRLAVEGPAGAGSPATGVISDDAEVGLELLSVLIGHGLERRKVSGEPRIGHVGSEDRQSGHEHCLRRRERRSVIGQPIEHRSRGLEIGRCTLERTRSECSGGCDKNGRQRKRDQQGDADDNLCPEPASPRQWLRRGGRHRVSPAEGNRRCPNRAQSTPSWQSVQFV